MVYYIRHFLTLHSVNKTLLGACSLSLLGCDLQVGGLSMLALGYFAAKNGTRVAANLAEKATAPRRLSDKTLRTVVCHLLVYYIRHFLTLHSVNKTLFDTT